MAYLLLLPELQENIDREEEVLDKYLEDLRHIRHPPSSTGGNLLSKAH